MKTKSVKQNKSKEITISAAELSRIGIGIMSKVLDTAKKGKITIRLEKD